MNPKESTHTSPGFMKGLLRLLPMFIIGALLIMLLDFAFDLVKPLSHLLAPGSGNPHWSIHIISACTIALLVFGLGYGVQTAVGKKVMKIAETRVFHKLPFYTVVNEITQRFSGIKDMPFSRVVLVDPFGNGSYLTGFVVDDCVDEIITVFVPTAPNPTNGNIYNVPLSNVKFVDISPQQAMQTIIGMGTGTSTLFENIKKPTSSEAGCKDAELTINDKKHVA